MTPCMSFIANVVWRKTWQNIKSQKKRVLTNEKAHKRNVAVKSSLKTAIRATREAIAAGDKAAAEAAYKVAPRSSTRPPALA